MDVNYQTTINDLCARCAKDLIELQAAIVDAPLPGDNVAAKEAMQEVYARVNQLAILLDNITRLLPREKLHRRGD